MTVALAPSVVCAGMVVVDHVAPPIARLPRAGELVPVDQLILNIGGGAANTAVDLTTLGASVSICARVGDDILGRFATATPGPCNCLEPLRTVLPHTDIFVPNTDEAALILGEDDPVRQALIFRDMGARRVVITRGEQGLISVSDDHRVKLGAYPVDFVD